MHGTEKGEAGSKLNGAHIVALRLGLLYFVISAVWIVASDWVVYEFLDVENTALAQTLKGLAFVFASGALIMVLAHRWMRAVHKSAEDLKEAQRLARLGSFSWTFGDDEVFWSDGMRRLLGWDPTARVSIQEVEQKVHHPDDNDRVMGWIRRGVEDGAAALGPEVYRLIRVNGEVIWVEVNIRIQRNRSAGVTVFGACQDITSRVEMERALLGAKAQAEQAAKAKSVFLASLSHEFRTPLNAIIGFSEVLHISAQEQLSPKQQEQLKDIQTAAQQLYGLVTDVLELTHAEQMDFRIEPSTVSLQKAVDDAAAQVRFLATRHDVQIQDRLHAMEEVMCYADPARVRQVLVNLLSNAIKYNHRGGSVTIDLGDTSPDKVRLRVTDTGCGIPETQQAAIFNIFSRVDGQALVAGEGTGVGLTIAKSLVERMGGEIGVESVVGAGSTFWCDFPRP